MTTLTRAGKFNLNYDESNLDKFKKTLDLAKKGDSNALDQLCKYFLPLIRSIAGMLAKRGVYVHYSYDDLIQEGSLGLLDAIKKTKSVDSVGRFVAYAKLRIHGQMCDALRTYSDYPRFILDGVKACNKITQNLENKLKYKPKSSEINSLLPGDFKKIYEEIRLVAEGGIVHSETIISYGDINSIFDSLSDGTTLEDLFYQTQILNLIKGLVFDDETLLNTDERRVMELYYFYSLLSLAEIGKDMGFSESRACQLKIKACKKIRLRIK